MAEIWGKGSTLIGHTTLCVALICDRATSARTIVIFRVTWYLVMSAINCGGEFCYRVTSTNIRNVQRNAAIECSCVTKGSGQDVVPSRPSY